MADYVPEPTVVAFILCLARVSPTFFLVPYLGSRHTHPLVKVALAVIMTLAVVPHGTVISAGFPNTLFGLLIVKELAVGSLIAVLASLVVYAAEMAGSTIAASWLPRSADNLSWTSVGNVPMDRFLGMLTIVVYLSLGGHHLLIRALASSFTALPMLDVPLVDSAILMQLLSLTGHLFVVAFAIAAPAVLAGLIVVVAMAAGSRVAWRAHDTLISVPARTLVVLLVAIITLHTAVEVLVSAGSEFDSGLLWLLRSMGGG